MPCRLVGGTGVGAITRGMLRGGRDIEMRKERLNWKKIFPKPDCITSFSVRFFSQRYF